MEISKFLVSEYRELYEKVQNYWNTDGADEEHGLDTSISNALSRVQPLTLLICSNDDIENNLGELVTLATGGDFGEDYRKRDTNRINNTNAIISDIIAEIFKSA